MAKFHIYSKAGVDMGVYEAGTVEQAVLAMHRNAGYDKDVVWLDDDGRLAFRDQDAIDLCGDVDHWDIDEEDAA